MNRNARVWMLLGLCGLCLGLWLWRESEQRVAADREGRTAAGRRTDAAMTAVKPGVREIKVSDLGRKALPEAERLKLRLSNTTQSEAKLLLNNRAILLANALIDTTRPLEDLRI